VNGVEWRRCKYCPFERYCLEEVMKEHEKNCSLLPKQYGNLFVKGNKPCPRCKGSLLVSKLGASCLNFQCGYKLSVIPEGKV
jgi:hypothetical protein